MPPNRLRNVLHLGEGHIRIERRRQRWRQQRRRRRCDEAVHRMTRWVPSVPLTIVVSRWCGSGENKPSVHRATWWWRWRETGSQRHWEACWVRTRPSRTLVEEFRWQRRRRRLWSAHGRATGARVGARPGLSRCAIVLLDDRRAVSRSRNIRYFSILFSVKIVAAWPRACRPCARRRRGRRISLAADLRLIGLALLDL